MSWWGLMIDADHETRLCEYEERVALLEKQVAMLTAWVEYFRDKEETNVRE